MCVQRNCFHKLKRFVGDERFKLVISVCCNWGLEMFSFWAWSFWPKERPWLSFRPGLRWCKCATEEGLRLLSSNCWFVYLAGWLEFSAEFLAAWLSLELSSQLCVAVCSKKVILCATKFLTTVVRKGKPSSRNSFFLLPSMNCNPAQRKARNFIVN